MVSQGIWKASDDYGLVDAPVDWDSLLEHQTGELCTRRWKELIRSVDRHCSKTFTELVETLSKLISLGRPGGNRSHGAMT
ncbi:hypothetical protein MLD38_008632 [Melastoma candidum]|uniref:Uncharacterized protein n=1 Tax=Melastoma candidum TaxID=119954 RepID=A0ACB9S3H0_9MYRT|nr:hypothetical protein MLD38_008632 [Melastoma candidum]